jgi:hypothetical protein
MSKKTDTTAPKQRRSPNQTYRNISEEFMQDLGIPDLPEQIPTRLEDALRARVQALLFHLREARREGYVKALEVRLVRDAHSAVLTAYELKMREAEEWYASFRQLVEDLGYERTDVGFTKLPEE